MAWIGAAAAVGSSLIGGLLDKSSAKKAAKQQQAAAREAQALQEKRFQQARQDFAPYTSQGAAAQDKLGFLLGTSGGANPAIAQAKAQMDAAQSAYNAAQQSTPNSIYSPGPVGDATEEDAWGNRHNMYLAFSGEGGDEYLRTDEGIPGGGGAGHRREVAQGTATIGGGSAAALANLQSAQAAYAAAQAAPWETPAGYGSLLDKYEEFKPYEEYKPFTGQDMYDDPGYEFRLREGLKGVGNSGASRGMQLSGSQAKGLQRYGQDYASNEFGAARGRYVDDYTRGRGNYIDDYTMGRSNFISDQDQSYNYLSGATNRGLNAVTSMSGIGQNNANQRSEAIYSGGNAASAGTVAGGNALNSGINSAYNSWNDWNDARKPQSLGSQLRGNYPSYGGGPGDYQGDRTNDRRI